MFSTINVYFIRAGNALRLIIAGVFLAISGCGAGGNDSPAVSAVASDTDASTANIQLAERLYAGTQRLPAGFLSETSQYPDRSEFKFHVSNTDVGIASVGGNRFEVCSDDFAQALDWSADAANARSLTSDLTATDESDWYFQFDRTINASEPAMVVNRVFKCATLDRSAKDDVGHAGVINRSPATADDLRFISEYLWQFTMFNNAFHAVIDSRPDTGTVLAHTIERAQMLIGGGAGADCDRVEVWHWTHTMSAAGILAERDTFVRDFDVSRQTGVVAACQP